MPKKKAEERAELRTGVIYCGDNLDVMERLPSESIDLIYIDPPFFSNRQHEIIWGNGAELRAFGDRWKGGISVYVEWMKERLIEMHRLLKSTGSLYVHLDHHAVHYLKCVLDDIFGMDKFRTEIIWKRGSAHSDTKQGRRQHGRIHDTILFYTRGDEWTWHPQYMPYNQKYVDGFYKYVEKETGRRYRLDNLTGPGGASKGNPEYEVMGVTRHWRYSKEKMKKLIKEGRVIQTRPGAVPAYKRYLDEMPGVPLQDIWLDIKPVGSRSKERRGYPTQKPEALLERIIKSSSNKGDVVADFFMGGGTTFIVAERLGRRWIGCDVSPIACKDSRREIKKVIKEDRDIEIIGMPHDIDELKAMEPFEFQNHIIVDLLHGTCSRTKSADYGIDGHDFGHNPVQVKQSEHIGRPVVQKFHSAVRREKRKKGIIVAFSFSKTAYEEAARIKLDEDIEIELRTVQELIADHYRRMGRE